MPRHAVAEIDAPGQRGGYAIGHVIEASEIAPDAADRDRSRQRCDEPQPRRAADARQDLERLDREDAARERTLDAPRHAIDAREPEIGGAHEISADSSAQGGDRVIM